MDIEWMFQNEPVDEKRDDIIVSNLGKRGKQLSIESVGAAHAGEYTCVASNAAGTATRTAVLNINGIILTKKNKIFTQNLCPLIILKKFVNRF